MMPFYEFGLLGYPLEHSFSPIIHRSALQAMGIEGSYNLYPVMPSPQGRENALQLLASLRAGRIKGLNITVPYKRSFLADFDELTPTAQAVGAVNTVFMQNRRLVGENSDVAGFLVDIGGQLNLAGPRGWQCPGNALPATAGNHPRTALLLGAGGAARAVAYGLAISGWQVILLARRPAQAAGLARQLADCCEEGVILAWSMPLGVAALRTITSQVGVSLVVNTTPVGMYPQTGRSPWPAAVRFPRQAIAYDLVYNPPETLFLKQARKDGLRTANGLGMLVEQAAISLQCWLGRDVPREPMFRALETRLAAAETPSRERGNC